MATILLKQYIKQDLYNELRWLLVGATHWAAFSELVETKHLARLGDFPIHFKVLAMDSVFLHSRALYEFFTATRTSNRERLTWKDYGLSSGLASAKYSSDLMKDLHGRSMHVNKDRSSYNPIKDEVVNIANDILDLWNTFINDPAIASTTYRSDFERAKSMSINESSQVAAGYSQYEFRALFT